MSGSQKQQQSKQTQSKQNTKKAPEQTQQGVNLEQLTAAPETMRSEEILTAQQQVGNQVVQRVLDASKEREKTTDKEGFLNDEISGAIQQKRGGGSPLPASLEKDVSKRFKRSFDDVRIHTDEQANELSQKINARAFTIGKDIFFKKGVFSPGSSAGRETLMHELTHVVQQSAGSGTAGRLKLGAPDTAHEKQADKVGKANSDINAIKSGASNAVQKQGIDKGLEEDLEKGEVQMQEMEEEELQMQPDTAGVVQRVANDEEKKHNKLMEDVKGFDKGALKPLAPGIGPALDDDAIQAQPDVGGVVQRDDILDKVEEKKEEDVLDAMGLSSKPKSKPKPKETSTGVKMDVLIQQMGKRSVMDDIKDPKRNIVGSKNELKDFKLKKVKDEDKNYRDAPDLKLGEKMEKSDEEQKKLNREQLMNTLGDTTKSKEEIEEAQEKLKSLHGGTKKEFRQASKKRNEALKNSAALGDDDAYKKLKSEKKPSKATKFGKGALGLAKGFFGSAAKDLKTQLFGEEKKEEKKEAPASAGGGSGLASLLEEKITENQKLRSKLEENNIPID